MEDLDQENLGTTNQAMKAFVGGLAPTTTEAQLRDYFGQYGPLIEVSVMREKTTGRSRGFAFLTYEDIDSLEKSLVSPKHQLDGRTVEVKRAIPRGEVKTKSRKVFVGGVPPSSTNESLRACFEKYGPISDAQIMKDRVKNRSRGFGFVTFEDDESVPKVLSVAEHRLDGKLVDVKKAEPKKSTVPPLQVTPAMAHLHPSPNSSPRGSLAFAPVLNPYVPYAFVPYPMVNNDNFSSLGFAGPGYADATSAYFMTSPYTSPRGSFTGESDLPQDFIDLTMAPFRRLSHDFSALSLTGGPLGSLTNPSLSSHQQLQSQGQSQAHSQMHHNTSNNTSTASATGGSPTTTSTSTTNTSSSSSSSQSHHVPPIPLNQLPFQHLQQTPQVSSTSHLMGPSQISPQATILDSPVPSFPAHRASPAPIAAPGSGSAPRSATPVGANRTQTQF